MQQQLYKIFEDAWEYQMHQNPIIATFYGDHRYNDRLPSLDIADLEKEAEKNKYFLQELDAIDVSKLLSQDKINYEIFRLLLEEQVKSFSYKSYYMPISQVHGFHIFLPEIVNYTPFREKQDYQNYLSRLTAIKGFIEGHIVIMRDGIRTGYTIPQVALGSCQKGVEAQIVQSAEASAFFRPFTQIPNHFSEHKENWQQQAKSIIEQQILPAYKSFNTFIKEEYIPSAKKEIGISSLPQGKEYYEFLVTSQTTLDVTPQEVYNTGIQEVERIKKEMFTILEKVNFKGTLEEFHTFLHSNEEFYATTEKQLISEVCYILKTVDGVLPKFFNYLPRTPYGIKEVPTQIASRMPTAYYMPPSGDGSSPGFYFVNTYDLKSRPLYELEALSLHEAMPGHHLQIALQQELQHLPKFRRFAKFLGFLEGWALYTEKLGKEMGMYQSPYSEFGRLTYEMWRACRLVVDTGIHYFGWTRQQAIDYLTKNSSLAKHNIETEVDRYISLPGQAVSYKMGELEVISLRRLAEEKLGEKFDIRVFHDFLLRDGAVPLSVLRENINNYIADVLATT